MVPSDVAASRPIAVQTAASISSASVTLLGDIGVRAIGDASRVDTEIGFGSREGSLLDVAETSEVLLHLVGLGVADR